MPHRVLQSNQQRTERLDLDRIRRFVEAAAGDIWDRPVEISLTFLGPRAMASANREHRGYQGATDQISFPMPDDAPRPDRVALVGDLLVCPALVAAQSATPPPDGRPVTGNPDRELALVLCHGLLHLRGRTHGDADDTTAMIAEESRLFAAHAPLLDGAFLTSRPTESASPESRRP